MKEIKKQIDHGCNEPLSEAADEICGDFFNAKQFGRRLRSYCGRCSGGKLIEAVDAGGGVKKYRLRPAEGGLGGFGGFGSPRAESEPSTGYGAEVEL